MQRWQMLMENGNTCFNAQAWLESEHCYKEAIKHIEEQWQAHPENMELLMGWISGQHNLALLYEVQGSPERALRYLIVPYHWLKGFINNHVGSDTFRELAMRALKMTLMPLLEFSQRHPICDNCYESLDISAEWLASPSASIH